jgi:hypothetical protein
MKSIFEILLIISICLHQIDAIVEGWTVPTPASSDYFNSDMSMCDNAPIALARTGEGRCGLIFGRQHYISGEDDNYREYIQGNFIQPLIAGKQYRVKFYVALDRTCIRTTKDIGCFISKTPVTSSPTTMLLDSTVNDSIRKAVCPQGDCDAYLELLTKPQIVYDKLITAAEGWVEISGIYHATGGEKYITIGNFSHSKYQYIPALNDTILYAPHIRKSVYFYLDDVSVTEYDSTNKKSVEENPYNHYLFLVDISNSMNEEEKLTKMKKEIKRFADSLAPENSLGLMVFSNHCKLFMPFTLAKNAKEIDSIIDKLKANGSTNGDLALRTLFHSLDSLRLRSHCQVIMATDGIFPITDQTRKLADSLLKPGSIELFVLQFGKLRNPVLEEISGNHYVLVRKKKISSILDKQQLIQPTDGLPRKESARVYYHDLKTLQEQEQVKTRLILKR